MHVVVMQTVHRDENCIEIDRHGHKDTVQCKGSNCISCGGMLVLEGVGLRKMNWSSL